MNRLDYLHDLYRLTEGLPENIRRDVLEVYKEHFRVRMERGEQEEQIAYQLGNPAVIADRVKVNPRTAHEIRMAGISNTNARLSGSTTPQGGTEHQMPPNDARTSKQSEWNNYQYSQPFNTAGFDTRPYGAQFRQQGNSPMKSLGMFVILSFMNLIFVLGPWIALAGVLISFWASSFGMLLGGIVGSVACLIGPTVPFIGMATGGLSIATAIAACAVLASLGVLFGLLSLLLTKWFMKLTTKYVTWNIQLIIGRRSV